MHTMAWARKRITEDLRMTTITWKLKDQALEQTSMEIFETIEMSGVLIMKYGQM